MNEFKKVPNAQAYEINSDAKIRKVADQKPVVVSKDGKALLKRDDGAWEYFVAEDLARALFLDPIAAESTTTLINEGKNEEAILPTPSEIIATNGNTRLVVVGNKDTLEWSVGITEALIGPIENIKTPKNKKAGKELKELQKKIGVPEDGIPGPLTDSALKGKIAEILKKDCSESIKVWKLHKLGCSTNEILAHLKQPKKKGHSFTSIIWDYKQNKKRRDRADSK